MNERRFRASIYVEIYVKETDDLEDDRLRATEKLREYQQKIPDSYIGGVAHHQPSFVESLDREI